MPFYQPQEKELDHVIGKDRDSGGSVRYRTTFFEDRIEETIKRMQFGAMHFDKFMRFDRGCVRSTEPNTEGIACTYTRKLPGPPREVYDLNDHQKLEEIITFSKGQNKTILRKGDYMVEFEYMGPDERAHKAVDDAFAEFNTMVEKSTGRGISRPLRKEDGGGRIKARFGAKEDKFDLQYELIFQYLMLSNFLRR
ncbi:MAG: hypothetical protein R6U32_03430 [Candidatus Woesearchaeota archaeon]